MKRIIFSFLIALFAFSCSHRTIISTSNNTNSSIVFNNKEVIRFWEIYDSEASSREKLFKEFVLDGKNNPAIHIIYNRSFRGRPELLYARVKKHKDYYESIREHSLQISSTVPPELEMLFAKFQKMYPEAHQARIAFTMGRFSMAGTAGKYGLVIGTEFFGVHSPYVDSLGDRKDDLYEDSELLELLLHEHMHFEQIQIRGFTKWILSQIFGKHTLLKRALEEGTADFLASLVMEEEEDEDEDNYIYGKKHEKELWDLFSKEMHSAEAINSWMFDYDDSKDTPPDLGYFMGAQICKSYYENAPDKKKAIKDILSIKDAEQFLIDSKYAEKFK